MTESQRSDLERGKFALTGAGEVGIRTAEAIAGAGEPQGTIADLERDKLTDSGMVRIIRTF